MSKNAYKLTVKEQIAAKRARDERARKARTEDISRFCYMSLRKDERDDIFDMLNISQRAYSE